MSDLDKIYLRLSKRLDRSEQYFLRVVAPPSPISSNQRWLVTEGVLSQCWQAWGAFCRDLLMTSGLGGTTRSGTRLIASVTPSTWERLSYVAICAASKRTAAVSGLNNLLRREPTWGDVVKLGDIIAAVKPTNATTLASAFGSISRGPIHLQKVRNTAAHINHQTIDELKAIRPFYTSPQFTHPSDVAFWIDPTTNDYAFMSWLDDMRIVADYATR